MPRDDRAETPRDRQHERAERVESILDEVETDVRDRKYPVRSEELATEYADQPLDLPNETESVGSAFDRLDEEYDTPEAVRESLYNELSGKAGGRNEYNDERDPSALDEATDSDTA